MFLLATMVFLVIIIIALIIGGLGIVITGSLGILFALADFVVGGMVLLIPIHIIKKHRKKKKEAVK